MRLHVALVPETTVALIDRERINRRIKRHWSVRLHWTDDGFELWFSHSAPRAIKIAMLVLQMLDEADYDVIPIYSLPQKPTELTAAEADLPF